MCAEGRKEGSSIKQANIVKKGMNVVKKKKKWMEYELGLSWPFILTTNQRNINVKSFEIKMIFFLYLEGY